VVLCFGLAGVVAWLRRVPGCGAAPAAVPALLPGLLRRLNEASRKSPRNPNRSFNLYATQPSPSFGVGRSGIQWLSRLASPCVAVLDLRACAVWDAAGQDYVFHPGLERLIDLEKKGKRRKAQPGGTEGTSARFATQPGARQDRAPPADPSLAGRARTDQRPTRPVPGSKRPKVPSNWATPALSETVPRTSARERRVRTGVRSRPVD